MVGLKITRLQQLQKAHNLAILLNTGGKQPSGEKALRPLQYLVREDQSNEVPQVWSAAVELGESESNWTHPAPRNERTTRELVPLQRRPKALAKVWTWPKLNQRRPFYGLENGSRPIGPTGVSRALRTA